MKNIIKLIAILAMCFMVVGMLASCNKKEQPVDNNDNNQTSTEPDFAWVTNEDGTKELYVNGEATGIIQNENNENECPDGKHDFVSVCEHIEHEEDETKDDLYVYKCVDCGYVEIETKGHDYVHVSAKDVAVGCENDGWEHHECRCGDWKKVNVKTALGHTYKAFDKDNLAASTAAGWEQIPDESGECTCQIIPIYVNTCERCGEDELQPADPVNHQNFKFEGVTYAPAERGSNVNPCTWVPIEIAQCTLCGCKDCVDSREIAGAKAEGHKFTEWYVVKASTATEAGELRRDCTVTYGKDGSLHCDGYETVVLPAWNTTDYTPDHTAPTCVKNGEFKYIFNGVTKKDGTKFIFTAVDETVGNHVVTKTVDVVAPTKTTAGKVTAHCDTEGCEFHEEKVLEFTLVALNNALITTHGTCYNPVDEYTYKLATKADNGEAVKTELTFKFTSENPEHHPHNVTYKPDFSDCIELEKDGKICYVTLCYNDGCKQYIVVGYKEDK